MSAVERFESDGAEVHGRRIAVDDYVKVLPTPGKRDSFYGKVKAWWLNDENVVTAIDVWGGKIDHERMRTLTLDRIEVLSTRKQNAMKAGETERAMAAAERRAKRSERSGRSSRR